MEAEILNVISHVKNIHNKNYCPAGNYMFKI